MMQLLSPKVKEIQEKYKARVTRVILIQPRHARLNLCERSCGLRSTWAIGVLEKGNHPSQCQDDPDTQQRLLGQLYSVMDVNPSRSQFCFCIRCHSSMLSLCATKHTVSMSETYCQPLNIVKVRLSRELEAWWLPACVAAAAYFLVEGLAHETGLRERLRTQDIEMVIDQLKTKELIWRLAALGSGEVPSLHRGLALGSFFGAAQPGLPVQVAYLK